MFLERVKALARHGKEHWKRYFLVGIGWKVFSVAALMAITGWSFDDVLDHMPFVSHAD